MKKTLCAEGKTAILTGQHSLPKISVNLSLESISVYLTQS